MMQFGGLVEDSKTVASELLSSLQSPEVTIAAIRKESWA